MSQPFDQQPPPTPQGPPPQPGGQQPHGTPPPMPPVPPRPAGPGYGSPQQQGQQAQQGPQPVAGNPYAQPVQDAPPQGYGYGTAQPGPHGGPQSGPYGAAQSGPYGGPQSGPYGGPQPGPYGTAQTAPHGADPQDQPPGPYGSPGPPGAPGPYASPAPGGFPPPQPGPPAPRKKTGLVVVAAVLALAVVGGGIWFAVGRGNDDASDTAKPPAPVAAPSESGPGESPEPADPTADPEDEPSASPPARSDNPFVPRPTGTGLQAVWKLPDSTMLGLGDEFADQPARINAILSFRGGLECKGRWQEDESGGFLEMALLCEEDGVRVKSKDRVGNLRQNGDKLTVTWKKGATGTDTFERFGDMNPS
ncbi:hypothetical protein ACIQRC_03370 [Streptomyces californicus]|uniref:hypothetical protein n=1 Tax=Streptomyces californicus TaxID=67351 RepID=UPI00381A5798